MSEWAKVERRTSHVWIKHTPDGPVSIRRVGKYGVPAFRVYFPDGKYFTAASEDEAKAYADRNAQQLPNNMPVKDAKRTV